VTSDGFERFLALVRREMRADDVRVLPANAEPSVAANVLYGKLHDGRTLAIVFAQAPEDREALVRRLAMLTSTFAQSLEARSERRPSRPTASRSLQDELRALATRAHALDALVIDANSPVVWGAAIERSTAPVDPDTVALVDVSRRELIGSREDPEAMAQDQQEANPTRGPSPEEHALSDKAVAEVRGLPTLSTLHKGGHLRHVERRTDLGFLAQSFAGIYLLVVVYGAPFDELRAERAVGDALPRIERLVLALPPLDPRPAPTAGVIAFRRPRRR
jgi:hypothetical protein